MKTKLNCAICKKDFEHESPHALTCSRECRAKRRAQLTGRISFLNGVPKGTVGAISEMMVASDLMGKGFSVFRALSPSCFCDLIAVKNL